MTSGEVNRPTPTTGLSVNCLTKSTMGSWLPSGAKRDGAQSVGLESIFTSQRSVDADSRATTSCASDGAVVPGLAAQFLQADAQCHRASVAHGLAGDIEQFAHQPHAVLDAAAVGVGAVVVFGQQEFVGQVAHARIDVNDVETRLHGAARARRLPPQQITRCPAASMLRGRRLPMNPRWVDSHGMPDGDSGAMRLVRLSVQAPPCHSSIPASDP